MATLYREAAESFVIQRAKGGKYHSLLVMGISSKAGYPHPFAKQAGSRGPVRLPSVPSRWHGSGLLLGRDTRVRICVHL